MQARPVPQRLTTVFRDRNVLNCSSSRPSRRTALTQTSSRNSSSQQAPPSSPCDERTKYTNDGYTTYRNRTSASNESSRPLPLPPLMDPIALSARERWTEPKKPAPTKKEDLTPFQRKLYANPFAHALATPIRLDRTTATHQPAFHHLALHARAHPETSQPHLLPTHLHAAALPSSKKPAHSTPAPTPSAYFLLRAPLLRLLTTSRGQRWRSAINLRVHDKTRGNLVWRPDMPDHVRALLQRIVFRRLQWCFSKPNGGGMLAGIPPPNNDDDEPLTSRLGNEAGAVLFLRRVVRREVRDAEQRVRGALEAGDDLVDHLVKVGEAARRALKEKPLPRAGWGVWETGGPRLHPGVLYAPLEYPSVGYKAEGESGKEGGVEREIPVYDLVELLGEEMLAALLGGTAWEGEQAVVLKEKETTIGAHHALMQLQDYVIESV